MELIDTHCHIHFPDYELDPDQVIAEAGKAGVSGMLCVGCSLADSELAVKFARKYPNIWATLGLHPHESKDYVHDHPALQRLHELAKHPEVVAIGEIGLDYHYMHSTEEDQKQMFRYQLDLAVENKLPVIFHVREAFGDFFSIVDEYHGIRGVVHSFSAAKAELDEILKRGFYVGLNGIMTFTKQLEQLEAAKAVPLEKLLLETDAPFLTPVPFRGTICEPKHVRFTAEFIAKLRGEPLEELARATTANARNLFSI